MVRCSHHHCCSFAPNVGTSRFDGNYILRHRTRQEAAGPPEDPIALLSEGGHSGFLGMSGVAPIVVEKVGVAAGVKS